MTAAAFRFLQDPAGTVIVSPSPHGEYKSGISFNDARALGELYAKCRNVKNVDVCSPEFLDSGINRNLILLGGGKVNPFTGIFQSSMKSVLTFDLQDEVIYDKENSVVLTACYSRQETRSIDHVTSDYGLVVYTGSPFAPSKRVLLLAGIKGSGTLAAVMAVTADEHLDAIERRTRRFENNPVWENGKTIEILVKISARGGMIDPGALTVEKIKVSGDGACWKWESEGYKQRSKVAPHQFFLTVIHRPYPAAATITAKLDDHELKFSKGPDRLKMLYVLAEQSRSDHRKQSPNSGWVTALELAEKIWRVRFRKGTVEIPSEIRREIANMLIAWARHMEKQGKLKLGADKLDHDYVNSEILVFDFHIRKKVADMVYLINQEEKKRFGPDFQFIESQPHLGYRLNVHPSLIFIHEAKQGGRPDQR